MRLGLILIVMVLKLRIGQIKEVVSQLEGEFLELTHNRTSEAYWGIDFPIKVCVTKPLYEGDIHCLYLIDTIGVRLIGKRVLVHLEPMYRVDGSKYYVRVDGSSVSYVESIEYSYYNDGLIISSTSTPLPTGTYKNGTIRYPNKTYYSNPMVRRSVLFKEFIPQQWLDDISEGTGSEYQEWVLDYLAKVELLDSMWWCVDNLEGSVRTKYTEHYNTKLKDIQDCVLSDIKTLISNYKWYE